MEHNLFSEQRNGARKIYKSQLWKVYKTIYFKTLLLCFKISREGEFTTYGDSLCHFLAALNIKNSPIENLIYISITTAIH